jgi:ABC-2 type transport system permease protein
MATVTTSAPAAGLSPLPPASGRAGLAGTLASEWTKIRSVRSTYWTLLALVVVGVGLGALISWATDNHITHLGHGAPLGFDATRRSQTAFTELGSLVLMVLGAMVITAEYSTGMIRTSLTAMPRRGVVYAAKALVFAAVTLTVSLVTSFASFFVGQAILASKHLNTTLAQPGVLRAVLMTAAVVAVFGLFAYGVGAFIRHSAGAITAMLGVIFVIPLLAQALPASWYEDIERWLPGGSALSPIVTSAAPHSHYLFSAWGELAVFCGYAVVMLALGAWSFIRRDA